MKTRKTTSGSSRTGGRPGAKASSNPPRTSRTGWGTPMRRASSSSAAAAARRMRTSSTAAMAGKVGRTDSPGTALLRTRPGDRMPRPALLFVLSLAAAGGGQPRPRIGQPGPGPGTHSAAQRPAGIGPRARLAQHELAQRRPPADPVGELGAGWCCSTSGSSPATTAPTPCRRWWTSTASTGTRVSRSIGIHTPEFPPYAGEHDRGNVERALRKYGIEYPNAQDNDSTGPGTCTASGSGPASC